LNSNQEHQGRLKEDLSTEERKRMGWFKRLHWDAVTKKQEGYQGGFKNKDSGFREGGQWFFPNMLYRVSTGSG
jgi:hypothetical protein